MKDFSFKNLPKSIFVMGQEVAIRYSDSDDYWGAWIKETRTIFLDKNLKGEHLLQILLHEVMHAIYTFTGLKRGASEEKTVTILSGGLTDFLVNHHDILSNAYGTFTLSPSMQMDLLLRANNGEDICRKDSKPLSIFEVEEIERRVEQKELIKEALREVLEETKQQPIC